MKINEKLLNIPPYISTTWNHVATLQMQGSTLLITLTTGEPISIADLAPEAIEKIFSYHATYLDGGHVASHTIPLPPKGASLNHLFEQMNDSSPLRISFGAFDGIGTSLQHNPNQSDAPEIPGEIIEKIAQITKTLIPESDRVFQKPELGCHCFYCQIAHALQRSEEESQSLTVEEVINADELQFQQWEIMQTGENLYSVSSRLDPKEKYNVFLGEPLGCTCGNPGCEHLLAVLKS